MKEKEEVLRSRETIDPAWEHIKEMAGHGNYCTAGVKSDLSLDGLEVKSNHIVLSVSMVNVSDFYCCCSKLPQSYQLQTTPIYYPTVL